MKPGALSKQALAGKTPCPGTKLITNIWSGPAERQQESELYAKWLLQL